MRIKFLQTTPSTVPGYPFQAGQIVDVEPTVEWLAMVDGIRAEAILDTEPELAVARAPRPRRRRQHQLIP